MQYIVLPLTNKTNATNETNETKDYQPISKSQAAFLPFMRSFIPHWK
jgi:hypothetical protein